MNKALVRIVMSEINQALGCDRLQRADKIRLRTTIVDDDELVRCLVGARKNRMDTSESVIVSAIDRQDHVDDRASRRHAPRLCKLTPDGSLRRLGPWRYWSCSRADHVDVLRCS